MPERRIRHDATPRSVPLHNNRKECLLEHFEKKNTNSIYFVDIELSIRKYTLMFLEFLPNSPRFRLCFEQYS